MDKATRERLLVYISLYAIWVCALFALTGGVTNFHLWKDQFRHWDTHWYEQIATVGYAPDDYKALAFPPLYGYIIKGFSTLTGLSYRGSYKLLNPLFYLTAVTLFTELMVRVFALRSYVLLFIAVLTTPTGYLIFAGYSDLLFMALYWGALFLAVLYPFDRRSLMAQAAILIITPWVRIVGFSMMSWLVLRRYVVLVVLIPLAAWFYLNYHLTGNPLFFAEVQKRYDIGNSVFAGAMGVIRGLMQPIPALEDGQRLIAKMSFVYLPGFYLLAILAAIAWLAWQRQLLMAVSLSGLLLVSHSAAFWRSNVRYDMPMIPLIFIPLFYVAERKPKWAPAAWTAIIVLMILQFMLQNFYGNVFKEGGWGF